MEFFPSTRKGSFCAKGEVEAVEDGIKRGTLRRLETCNNNVMIRWQKSTSRI